MPQKDPETFTPASRNDWREWLSKNHQTKPSIWLVYHKKGSATPSLSWSDAVDEALCFGWIDSTRRPLDKERFLQLFSKRKPGSSWSKINKEKVEQLIAEGLMCAAGLESIETAKQNGSWNRLDEAESLTVPKDLARALKSHPGAQKFFTGLSRSGKKMLLQWLVLARRPETRQKRIAEITECAAQKLKPKPFR